MNIIKLEYQPLNLFHVILLSPICQHSVWSELTSHNPLPLKRDQASSLLIALKIRTEQSKLLRSSYSRNKYVVSYVSITHSRPWCNVNSRGRRQRSMSWKVKAKVYIYLIQRLFVYSESPPQKRSGMARVLKGFQFYLHTHTFIRNRNEPHLPLPSQL